MVKAMNFRVKGLFSKQSDLCNQAMIGYFINSFFRGLEIMMEESVVHCFISVFPITYPADLLYEEKKVYITSY